MDFNIFCCPSCNSELILDNNYLLCKNCNKSYLIKNDIVVLIDYKE